MTALYSGVGEVLTHYEVEVQGATLTKRAAVTLPENAQYAWPHPSKRYLYVASSNRGPTWGGDKHYLSAFRMDPAGALQPHGEPHSLAHRPVHMSLDVTGSYALMRLLRRAARSGGTLLTAIVIAAAAPCAAQTTWKPDKPVEFVVLSSPGGGNDRTARLMQRIWRDSKWLENVNVLNKPGGGGALAYTYVSQHAGDGHYIAVVRKGLLTNHILGRSPLHPTELTPLAVVANEPNAMAVRADSPIKNVKDLAERLKADPQSITTSVGSTRGGPSHMMVVQLAKLAGADPRKLKVVTFSGSNESVINLLGGHIEVMSSSVDALVPHHKAGAMRILGVATAERSAAIPNVPTFKDQGYDVIMGNWTAIMGPKGLAPAQVAYWEDLLERTFNHPAWKGMLEADALEADFRKSQPTRDLLIRDYELERRMLTELGMVR